MVEFIPHIYKFANTKKYAAFSLFLPRLFDHRIEILFKRPCKSMSDDYSN